MRILVCLVCFAQTIFLLGCAKAPVNKPLNSWQPTQGYRFTNRPLTNNSDELFVIVSFSGGGTRAAAFSFGALEGLRNCKIHWQGRDLSLLDEVDMISSVSGGSFTSASYGLFRDRIFQEYPEKFLYRNVTMGLAARVLNPLNWPRLWSRHFDRIDLASEYYNKSFFDKKSFADLDATGARPFLILNATDISHVSRFEFTQDQFDVIGSDLSSYPVARGVAASSAFPILLSPMSLRNYAPAPDYKRPQWLDDALADPIEGPREYAYAKVIDSYLSATNHPYVHLMDGGLSDNIGLRGPAYALTSIQNLTPLLNLLHTKVKYLVIVTVNAKPDDRNDWNNRKNAPGLVSVFGVVTGGPLGNYSDETVQYVRDALENRRQAAEMSAYVAEKEGRPKEALRPISFYNVSVSFADLEDQKERDYVAGLPTTFNLPRRGVDALRNAAQKIIEKSPELDRLREDLKNNP